MLFCKCIIPLSLVLFVGGGRRVLFAWRLSSMEAITFEPWLKATNHASIAHIWSDPALIEDAYLRLVPHQFPGDWAPTNGYYVNIFAETTHFDMLYLTVLDDFFDMSLLQTGDQPIGVHSNENNQRISEWCRSEFVLSGANKISIFGGSDYENGINRTADKQQQSFSWPRVVRSQMRPVLSRTVMIETLHRDTPTIGQKLLEEKVFVGRTAILHDHLQVIGCTSLLPTSIRSGLVKNVATVHRRVWRTVLADAAGKFNGSVTLAQMFGRGHNKRFTISTRMMLDLRMGTSANVPESDVHNGATTCLWWVLHKQCVGAKHNESGMSPNGTVAVSPTSTLIAAVLDIDFAYAPHMHQFLSVIYFKSTFTGDDGDNAVQKDLTRMCDNSLTEYYAAEAVCVRMEEWTKQ